MADRGAITAAFEFARMATAFRSEAEDLLNGTQMAMSRALETAAWKRAQALMDQAPVDVMEEVMGDIEAALDRCVRKPAG